MGFRYVDDIIVGEDLVPKDNNISQEAQSLYDNFNLQETNISVSKQLDLITSALPGGIKISNDDSDHSFKYISNQFADMLGFDTPEDLKAASGNNAYGLVHPDDLSMVLKESLEQYSVDDHYITTYRMKCKDGSYKYIEDHGNKVQLKDGTVEHWNLILDKNEFVNQTIELEIEKKSNQEKTRILSSMSHDIRTPMNAILGYSHLAKNQLSDSKLLSYHHKIEQSGNILLSIINNVLDMTYIDSGKATLDELPISIYNIPKDFAAVFSEDAKNKNIQLSYTTDIQHPNIICDISKLTKIFINIVSNSIKYTPEGGSINATVVELPSNRKGYGLYQTTISDTGVGMSEEFLPHIFDSFTREHNDMTSNVPGTGLGMSIVKNLIDLLGGTIQVTSELGVGTTFIVTIPHKLADSFDNENLSPAEEKAFSLESLKGRRILLAEDNDLNAEIAITNLENHNLKVDHAKDGISCIDLIKSCKSDYYSAILMDIQMPGMNGYDATKEIRGLEDKAKASIPIIAMTASAFDEDKKKALESGMDAHLSKPININSLLETLTKVIT